MKYRIPAFVFAVTLATVALLPYAAVAEPQSSPRMEKAKNYIAEEQWRGRAFATEARWRRTVRHGRRGQHDAAGQAAGRQHAREKPDSVHGSKLASG